ncbi:NTP pyrophosphatase (non-canonical NTP hydrolase) [Geothermobacter ehrlichii]|uniref:NTP pyrophosphatase (Non-canonical NTP hydrolase) n=1 Tax=Geothermobacter ehrlichii TaxID=213224 RepID=A0A5D3WN61_9BACT|nr:nucleotide pyrophosphohydrolase [Geothermobacter ehrlichii]TYP00008.1 NTP pyrophosphatase (non-canonical NTP hydrolase) [Geothermobacter ehrlichii]
MTDRETTLAELKAAMARFVEERNWRQYHTPKNLAMSVAIEAAELMEHFQWDGDIDPGALDERQRREIGAEMADVLLYLCSLSTCLDIDLAAATADKLACNRRRFPVERVKGRAHRHQWKDGG